MLLFSQPECNSRRADPGPNGSGGAGGGRSARSSGGGMTGESDSCT
jgi:hypothetical protein